MADSPETPSDINSHHEPVEEPLSGSGKGKVSGISDPLSVSELSTDSGGEKKKKWTDSFWKIELCLLCLMIAIALGGMALAQASQPAAWEYWILAVIAFCATGIFISSTKARKLNLPIRPIIVKHILHWAGLLFILKVMVIMEHLNFLNRQAAADASLLLLALACYLAGIHLNRMFLFVSVIIAAMVVGLVALQQYAMLIWLIMIPIVIVGLFIFYRKSRKHSKVPAAETASPAPTTPEA